MKPRKINSEELHVFMDKHELNQSQVARLLNRDVSTVSYWANGRNMYYCDAFTLAFKTLYSSLTSTVEQYIYPNNTFTITFEEVVGIIEKHKKKKIVSIMKDL